MQRLVFATALLLSLPGAGSAQHCLSQRLLASALTADSAVTLRRDAIAAFTKQYALNETATLGARQIATIEVVVHVVWRLPAENIADEQVFSQLEALNEDFRLLNSNQSAILAIFQALKADTELEFAMATTDPAGNPTNGIVRVQTDVDLIGIARDNNNKRRICYSGLGGSDAWCPSRYLNIWVGQFPEGIAGEASFPGQDTLAEDGVRIDPEHFGRTGTAQAPYNLGRTTTHEIGHYFNLYHLWGGNGDEDPLCQYDDEVADTPEQAYNYRQLCPSGIQQSCGTPDMYQNYLNYTDDACMALFTAGQKVRIWATLAGPRAGLLSGAGCSVAEAEPPILPLVYVAPNPAKSGELLQIRVAAPAFTLYLFDLQGKLWRQQELTHLEAGFMLPDLPPGLYLLQIVADGRRTVQKLVITR